jgi:peptidoglycan/xylan/chitin deacetylase (PgdA/CDA1 family)
LTPACAALVAVLLLPVSAQAVVPARQLPPPRPLPTVDHPPVDGVNSFDNGPRSVPRVALTFDADMTPGMLSQLRAGQVKSWYNREVRDILDAEGVHATVFLTGLWAQAYPEVARSMAEDPLLEIASHTYDHAAFRTPCYGLPGTADRAGEIQHAQDQILAVTGVRPNLIRFSAPAVAAIVLRNLQPGSIVIMHMHGAPNAPMTAPALRMIIQGARARGLEFGTVSEVLGRPGARPARPAPSAEEVLHPLRERKLEAPAKPPARPDRLLTPYRQLRLEGPRRFLWGFPGHLLP